MDTQAIYLSSQSMATRSSAGLRRVLSRIVVPYAGVAENSVDVDPDHQGRGVGRLLLSSLNAAPEAAGNWIIQTGVSR